MKKETAWKIFKFFSVLLIIDLVAIPVVGLLMDSSSNGCEDGILTCAGSFLIFLLLVGFFWAFGWQKIYAVFFMNEMDVENLSKRFPIFTSIFVKFDRWVCSDVWPNKALTKYSLVLVVFIECTGIGFLFFYQLYHILKSLIA